MRQCEIRSILSLAEIDNRIVGTLEYAAALFDASTIERHVACFRKLLTEVVADDQRVVGRLPLLSESERHRMLVEWNDTEVAYPIVASMTV